MHIAHCKSKLTTGSICRRLLINKIDNKKHLRVKRFASNSGLQYGTIWSGQLIPPIWPLAIFICGNIWNPVFMSTVRGSARLEGQHSGRNCQYTCWYADEGHGKHQKSVYSVHGQWGMSPTWCDFQNCVKQNFKCVLSLRNKNKTFMI